MYAPQFTAKKKENVPVPAAKKKTLTVRKKSQVSLPMTLIDSPETVKCIVHHQLTLHSDVLSAQESSESWTQDPWFKAFQVYLHMYNSVEHRPERNA